jgi:hypothetical protein
LDTSCRSLVSSLSKISLDTATVAWEVLISTAGWKEKGISGFCCGVMGTSAKMTVPFSCIAGREEVLPSLSRL